MSFIQQSLAMMFEKAKLPLLFFFALFFATLSSLCMASVKMRLVEVMNDLAVDGKVHFDLQIKTKAGNDCVLNSITADIIYDPMVLAASERAAVNWQINPSLGYMRTVVTTQACYRVIVANISAYDKHILNTGGDLTSGLAVDSDWQTLVTLEFIIRQTDVTEVSIDSKTSQVAFFENRSGRTSLSAREKEYVAEPVTVTLSPASTDSAEIRLRICRNDSLKAGILQAVVEMRTLADYPEHRLNSFRCDFLYKGGVKSLSIEEQILHFDTLYYSTELKKRPHCFSLIAEKHPAAAEGKGLLIHNQWTPLATFRWEITKLTQVALTIDKSSLYADYDRRPGQPSTVAITWLMQSRVPGQIDLEEGKGRLLLTRLVKRNENQNSEKSAIDLQLKKGETDATLYLDSFQCNLPFHSSDNEVAPEVIWSFDPEQPYSNSVTNLSDRLAVEVEKNSKTTESMWAVEDRWKTLVRLQWPPLQSIQMDLPETSMRATYQEEDGSHEEFLSGEWVIRSQGITGSEDAIDLVDFYASGGEEKVRLVWITLGESDNRGFYIFRSENKEGDFNKVNKAIIPGALNTLKKQEYRFEDTPPEPNKTYYYKLANVTSNGNLTYHGPVESRDQQNPEMFILEQNFPNPFNLQTTIPFTLYETAHVNLTIYNIKGQRIKTLCNKELKSGHYSQTWDGKDYQGYVVPSGTYFYIMRIDDNLKKKKMQLVK